MREPPFGRELQVIAAERRKELRDALLGHAPGILHEKISRIQPSRLGTLSMASRVLGLPRAKVRNLILGGGLQSVSCKSLRVGRKNKSFFERAEPAHISYIIEQCLYGKQAGLSLRARAAQISSVLGLEIKVRELRRIYSMVGITRQRVRNVQAKKLRTHEEQLSMLDHLRSQVLECE